MLQFPSHVTSRGGGGMGVLHQHKTWFGHSVLLCTYLSQANILQWRVSSSCIPCQWQCHQLLLGDNDKDIRPRGDTLASDQVVDVVGLAPATVRTLQVGAALRAGTEYLALVNVCKVIDRGEIDVKSYSKQQQLLGHVKEKVTVATDRQGLWNCCSDQEFSADCHVI